MGIQERKEREREQRKATIVACAMKVFLTKGIVEASMEEIADCAELSKATLYLYFKNKAELVFSVMGCVLDDFIRLLEEMLQKAETCVQKVEMVGEAYLRFYRECHGQYILLNSQNTSPDLDNTSVSAYSEVRIKSNKLWKIICDPIVKAIKEGYFRVDTNAIEVAISLWAASNGVLNLMMHVEASHKCKEFEPYVEKDQYLDEINKLDFEKMLRNSWNAIIQSYK
jgi:AcrR family transcriptional regulator